jgi:phosphatidylglycerophosphatase A
LAWLPFYWVGQTDAVSLFTLFVTFRVFDIIKIYPANWIDAQKSRWWAVIGDDLVSGIYAAGASYFLIPYLSKVLG